MVDCEFERVSDSGYVSPAVPLRLRRRPACWIAVCLAVVGVVLILLGCARTSSNEFAGEWVIASLLCNERELEGAKGNTVTIDQESNTLTFVQTMDGREMPERWHYSVNQAITPHTIDLVPFIVGEWVPGISPENGEEKGIFEVSPDGTRMRLCIGWDRPSEFPIQPSPSRELRIAKQAWPKTYNLVRKSGKHEPVEVPW